MAVKKRPAAKACKKKPACEGNASDGSGSRSASSASHEPSPTAASRLRERHPEIGKLPGEPRALEDMKNVEDQGVFTYLVFLHAMPAKASLAHVSYINPMPAKASPVKVVHVHDGL
jgi:hypothetical protein